MSTDTTTSHQSPSSNVTADLIRALVENMRGADENWYLLTFILEFGEGYRSAGGYAYSQDGTISAVVSNPRAIKPAVDAYLNSYYKPEEKLPIKILVQFSRATGEYDIQFEDKDEERWKVRPSNIATIREELRPNF